MNTVLDDALPGRSAAIRECRSRLEKLSNTELPLLITGETGIGKTYAAKAVHDITPFKDGPFVPVNLAAIPEQLASSELFGHLSGAFTGATRERKGLLERAGGGTIVLDEIGEASPRIQSLISSFLEDFSIRPIGSTEKRSVRVRVIAITNLDLSSIQGFRKNLFLQLAPGRISIPPLRVRPEDIPYYVESLLSEYNSGHDKNIQISIEALSRLQALPWPGNVRELANVLLMFVMTGEGEITEEDIEQQFPKPIPPKEDIGLLRSQLAEAKKELEFLRRNAIAARPIWEGTSYPLDPDYCFVLMPFSKEDHLQEVYQRHVKSVVEGKCGLRCERADDIYDVSGVMQSVWEGINKATIIIAELTNRNPNVFYELGIAHTLGKPVVMITQSMDFVPFDLRHLRSIVYEYTPHAIGEFERRLKRTIDTVLSSARGGFLTVQGSTREEKLIT